MRAVATFAEITTTTATRTLVQVVAPANRGIRLTEASITFQGTNNLAEPIKVELVVQTTAGTAAALTMSKVSQHDSNTIQTTAQETFTVEPTTTNILRTWLIHPQAGICYTVPHDEFTIPGGTRLGLRVVGTIATAVDCVGYLEIVE